MKFEKQDKLFLLLKKYDINQKELIEWFKNRKESGSIYLYSFLPQKTKSCMMELTANGTLCSIAHKYDLIRICNNCVFHREQGNYDDAKSIVEYVIKIIK